jgi:hypothetical protein
MKNILKKDAIDFIKRIEGILSNNNNIKEIKSHTSMKVYEINTSVGRLEIHTETWEQLKGNSIYSIFTRFDEPERVENETSLPINKCSGKYNFHMSDKDNCIESFAGFIDMMTYDL